MTASAGKKQNLQWIKPQILNFDIKGVDRSDARIREHMSELIAVAREQLANEAG